MIIIAANLSIENPVQDIKNKASNELSNFQWLGKHFGDIEGCLLGVIKKTF
jgi:hypothetical protein